MKIIEKCKYFDDSITEEDIKGFQSVCVLPYAGDCPKDAGCPSDKKCTNCFMTDGKEN